MRRDHTQTSPQNLYRPPINNYRSPYLSPSNDQRSLESNKSPPQRIDDFEKRFPLSHKYDYPQPSPPQPKSPPQKNYTTYEQSNPLQVSQLKLTISQLRSSLQISHDNQQRLQEELFAERSKTYDLSQIRRRLEEELKRLEFELDRLGNYETLENRQSSIKLQTLTREHSKVSHQVNDLLEQIKFLKQQHRKLMSECDILLKEKHILMAENETLLAKLNNLENEVHDIKREVAHHSQQQIHSRINSVVTGRSQFVPTIQGSPRVGSKQSIQLEEHPEEIDYEEENKRLMDDYQKLMVQNASMKQLYQQFYKNSGNQSESEKKPTKNESRMANNSKVPSKINRINNENASDQKAIRSFSNKRLVEQLNSSEEYIDNQIELMLKTSQKEQITQELASVRDAAIGELMKCYEKSLEQSQRQHNNSLKIFTQQISKKLAIFSKMSQNYLEIRATIQQDTKLVFPQSIKTLQPQNQKQQTILQIYQNVKQKAKGQAHIGLSLAIFRLLTLLHKINPINPIISDNMKHSALKYIYKISRLPNQTSSK